MRVGSEIETDSDIRPTKNKETAIFAMTLHRLVICLAAQLKCYNSMVS